MSFIKKIINKIKQLYKKGGDLAETITPQVLKNSKTGTLGAANIGGGALGLFFTHGTALSMVNIGLAVGASSAIGFVVGLPLCVAGLAVGAAGGALSLGAMVTGAKQAKLSLGAMVKGTKQAKLIGKQDTGANDATPPAAPEKPSALNNASAGADFKQAHTPSAPAPKAPSADNTHTPKP